MKLITSILAALLLLIQWPLWFGKGGWLRVSELRAQLDAQNTANAMLVARNGDLSAEVSSLKQGREAVEERARHELHMIRGDETFFQIVVPQPPTKP